MPLYHVFKFKGAFLILTKIEKNKKEFARIDWFDDGVVVAFVPWIVNRFWNIVQHIRYW